jgi:hypothetical protein
MKFNLPFITIGAITAIIIFNYMKNKQADRNDKRRDRLEERKEELMEQLRKNNPHQENDIDNDN